MNQCDSIVLQTDEDYHSYQNCKWGLLDENDQNLGDSACRGTTWNVYHTVCVLLEHTRVVRVSDF